MPAKPVYALTGADSFLQLEALARIKAQLPPDAQRIDVDGERAELADLLDELRSFSMFGGSKLVVVRDADELLTRYREQMENYVATPSDGSVLVLRFNAKLPKSQRIYKAIAKTGEIIECEPLAAGELSRWVTSRAKSMHKIALAPDAVALLLDLVGSDLGRLDNELAKLALDPDTSAGKPVTPDRIAGSVSFQREQEIKDMTTELALGNAGEAVRRWRQLMQLDRSAEFRAVTWLGMWLEDVGLVVRGGQAGKVSWKYKERFPQFLRVAQRMGEFGYARALDLLAEVDEQSKTGVGDASRNVERFMLDVGAALSSR